MNSQKAAIVTTVAVLTLTGVGWLVLPRLQAGPDRVRSQAIVPVERARRLLEQYNASLAYRALVLDQLRDVEVPVDAQDAADAAQDVGDEYQASHQALWAAFEPKDWNDGVGRPARASYGNLASQIREGANARAELVKQNARLLDEAEKEIKAALGVSAGDATGAEFAEAQRLQGVIAYHRGVEQQVAARVMRDGIEPFLSELNGLANEAAQIRALEGVLEASKIDEQIERLRGELAIGEERVAHARKELGELESQISALEAKLADAQARSQAARAQIDALRVRGVDFSDPQGAIAFARNLTSQYETYRAALKEAQELEAGSLPKAEIDYTGDFLRGRYLENGSRELTVQPGLSYYRLERAAMAARVSHEEAGVAAVRGDLERLEAGRKPYEAQKALAAARVPEIQKQAADAYAELNRILSEAEAIEEKGLRFLDEAVRASEQAAKLSEQWAATGRESTANLSPEAKERSAGNSRADDGWLAGFALAQVADARAVRAWIFYDRFNDARRAAAVLERLTDQVALRDVDLNALREEADQARASSEKEVELAMVSLDKAHKSAERHWTFAAQGAGMTYLMVLLGHDDYLADAIEGYRNAVKGREGDAAAQRFVLRLQELESRQP